MKFIKKTQCILLAAALCVVLPIYALADEGSFGNFTYTNRYTTGQFLDVRGTEWFARYVEDAYNFGFIRGKSENIFDHSGLLTFGEAITMTARLRSIYHTGKADFEESVPFYTVYADYALAHGIIDKHGDYSAPATRAQFAEILYNALPPEAFPPINDIADYGICDVDPTANFAPAVYTHYRAGILTGSDQYGTFFPDSNITRAEACAVMVRLADPATRVSTSLPGQIPAEIIFQRNADAVFMLETFTKSGRSIRTGSGFFFTETGLAVTNLHVLENAVSATIMLHCGDVYDVRGVYAISEEYNLAILSIDPKANGYGYLTIADSDLVKAGDTVYALGSPWELLNSITEGIISKTSREVSGETLIQFTAPISFGSGGSALLNTLGQVVGIASSSFVFGQNLNLAVPINHVKELEPGDLMTLEELLQSLK